MVSRCYASTTGTPLARPFAVIRQESKFVIVTVDVKIPQNLGRIGWLDSIQESRAIPVHGKFLWRCVLPYQGMHFKRDYDRELARMERLKDSDSAPWRYAAGCGG